MRDLSQIRLFVRALPFLAIDFLIVMAAYAAGLALRFDGNVPEESWNWFFWAVPLIGVAYLFSNLVFGVYRTAWQYGGLTDAFYLGLAVSLVTLLAFGINAMLEHRPIPLSVNLISGALILLFMGLVKLSPRLISGTAAPLRFGSRAGRGVIIVGAGSTGQLLARELLHNPHWNYRPLCFIDDDPKKKGVRIHSVPVLGNRYDIPTLVDKHSADLVALAVPTATAASIHELLTLCESIHVPVRIVPPLDAIVSGKAKPGEMREVTIDDLIDRDEVGIDLPRCRELIEGKSILITGAAGSIGSELARRVLEFKPASLHLLDANEGGLHELRVELSQRSEDCQIRPWMGGINDRNKVFQSFEAARPHLVFHSAAYKHVPLLEENPDQGFLVNVLGTLNVFQAARHVGTQKVIFLSSHAAMNPSSVMGATKRIGELLARSLGDERTKIAAVRLANVIDSRGGVMSTFWRQIQRGGPVSVTHPDVARYFLTVHEVASLILQVAVLADTGNVFVLDVGEEVKIADLAERMIRSKGFEPGRDMEIVFTGLRPGEKLRDDLVGEGEALQPTAHPKVFAARGPAVCPSDELLRRIAETEMHLARGPDAVAAELHALARLDLSAPTAT
ncbi:MAG: nucleoside-diphosphate sugar epimerase/dehydratase [Dehalococcoidia bacterium]|nr:nucleoside-diphosphate sugar epimerase/dehydratase [Dehalococcoidia bacterium]